MKPLIISLIVENNLCIGCGVCAALCPDSILDMRFNKYGEYNPVAISNCTKNCRICLNVCPFVNENPNEDEIGQDLYGSTEGINYRPEIGYFISSYVGHSLINGHRENGASGGMATWFLAKLLEEKQVDYVISVTHTNDPNKLFQYKEFKSVEELRSSSGSVYYPVELSGVINHILKTPGKYAIIGLPCFIKALRLAQKRNRNLQKRVVITLGLTCGQTKSKHYTAYLSAVAGLKGMPVRVKFRGKDLNRTARDYYFLCSDSNGKDVRLFLSELPFNVWVNRWFTPFSCNYCDDVFCETADITFMDAWLPEFSNDPNGTSFIISRSSEVEKMLNLNLQSNKVSLEKIDIIPLIMSKKGVIDSKKKDIAFRLYINRSKLEIIPKKRIDPKFSFNLLKIWRIQIITSMQEKSRNFVPNPAYSMNDVHNLKKEMKKDLIQIRILRFLSFPVRVYRYIGELIL